MARAVPLLSGPRVALEPCAPAHRERLREIHALPEVARWWGKLGEGWPAASTDPAESVDYAIVLEGEVIGFIQWYAEFDPMYRHAGLDVFLDPAFHGRGLGTEAARIVCVHLVDDLGFHRLIIDPEESRIGIFDGQELPRDLLIRAMLIVSANDAARMLAIDIAGGEPQFAELMNQQAGSLGLTNTRAVNVTGLDADGQFSSANDMTRLAAFLMGNQTFQLTVARTEAQLNGQTVPSTNDLLTKYPGADGVKTGRTTSAGWCIVVSAMRDGRRMIATVVGAPTEAARDAGATALLDWAFTQPFA